jgi:hypothetical protein
LKEDAHSPDAKLVKKRIAAIRKRLSPPASTTSQPTPPKLPPLPPIDTKGVIVIESAPEGAAIYLNDKKNGIFHRTPYTGSLPPGRHTIILELKEYKPVRKTIRVQNDVLSYMYFSLARQRNLGWIEIKGNIEGAKIYMDKRKFGAVGQTPYSGHLRPGKRKLIIERPGYEPYIKELEIIAGKTHVITFMLEKVKHGWLKISGKTTRGSQVKVDGKPFKCEEDYPCRGAIKPGKHKVRIEKKGHKPYETEIVVAIAREVQVAVRLHPKPSRVKAYVSLSVAAVLLGTGIAAGIYSNGKKSDLEDATGAGKLYDSDDSRLTEGKIGAIVANSLFALSGVVAGLGLYYLFRNEGPDSYGETRTRKIAITPIIGPSVAGIGTEVRF